MTVGFQAEQQLQLQLADQGQIALMLLVDRIDEDGLCRCAIRQQVRERAGGLIEQLLENDARVHRAPEPNGNTLSLCTIDRRRMGSVQYFRSRCASDPGPNEQCLYRRG